MPKKAQEPLQSHLIKLFEGDFDELRELFPDAKPNEIVRELVRDLINRKKANDPVVPKLQLELNLK